MTILPWGCTTIKKPSPSLYPVSASREPVKIEPSAPAPPSEDLIEEVVPELQPVEIKTPWQKYESKRYDFDLQSGNLVDVMRALVKGTEIGLVIDPGISSTQVPVMDLKNATLKEILTYILPPLNLKYEWKGKNIRIFKDPLVTRFFTFNYLSTARGGDRRVSYSTRSNNNSGSSGGSGGSGSSSGSGGGTGGSSGGSSGGENQSTSEITTSYQNAIWQSFMESMKVLVFGSLEIVEEGDSSSSSSGSGGGDAEAPREFSYAGPGGKQLIIIPSTGVVMVTAYEHEIDKIAQFMERHSGSAVRQVWIEAKIVEVDLDRAYQLGVDWGAVINRGKYYGTLDNKRTLVSPAMGFTPGSVENQSLSTSSGTFQFAVSNNIVDIMLDAISRQGNLKVLASPRISTLNNEKAVIRVVREESFFNLQTEISQGTGGNVSTPTINVQVVPIGIIMDIVPQVAENGDIILSVNPDISELLEIRSFEVEGALATQPVIDRRSIDTVARLKNGQTLVIAGIIKERKNEVLKGVPFLYKLPLLGNLFRRTEQQLTRTELVIFITPRLHSGKSAAQLTAQEKQRIRRAIVPGRLGDAFKLKEAIKGEVTSFKEEKNKK